MAEPVLDPQDKLTIIADLPRAELKGWLWQLRHARQRGAFPGEMAALTARADQLNLDLRQEASWTLG
ncbi:hypothetical protein [Salipiger marinus]|uniref:Uncharacterized protein n=1 Tax=Salipiger marinus TaxID=555512 RepID=A0A1G8T588_9RHOB|nr:hypothetical protein [Salipiger marinus]SDJ36712.1 hypothetical protein SAMN04487993_10283 [Salipiger marinus]